MLEPLPEVHVIGTNTTERIVRAENCRELASLGFAMLGLCYADTPYSMSTQNATRAFVLACVGGRGRVWVDGRWEICQEGDSYLCPKGEPHAYASLPRESWHFVWSLYDIPPLWLQGASARSRRARCEHVYALNSALEGLYRERNGPCEHGFMSRWAEMVHAYWRSTAEGSKGGKRLAPLWEKVDSRLAHEWTVTELARAAGISGEHLRRLCLAETGQSPMRYLSHLRMQRAEALLQTRRLTISAVAEAVGYTPFAFSAAFRKWSGRAPAELLKA